MKETQIVKETQINNNELFNKVLEALTILDQKGTNKSITLAIAVVYEGFSRQSANVPFSANDLVLSALGTKEIC